MKEPNMLKLHHKAIVLAVCAILNACAYVHKPEQPNNAVTHRVSPDYMALGHTENINAYIVGNRTIVEVLNDSALGSVIDSGGVNVPFEKVGRYYRLERALDSFTVTFNGHLIKFTNTQQLKTTVFSSAANVDEPVTLKAINADTGEFKQVGYSNEQAKAVLDLAKSQLNEIQNSLNTAKTSKDVNEAVIKLNKIESDLKNYTPTLFANYKSYETKFKLDADTSEILIDAAKLASAIKITGYTNSVNINKRELIVAKERAENARKFLINNGVASDKITTSAVPNGEFIAAHNTKKGGQYNRRVEIELTLPNNSTPVTQKL